MNLSFLKNISLYTGASWAKIFLGGIILLITFLQINIKEDPEIALTLLLIGTFIFARGISYFLFYGGELLFCIEVSKEQMQKDAYKTSFLFGLYALINVLLLIGGFWNKWLGILFLLIFISMQWIIFNVKKTHNE